MINLTVQVPAGAPPGALVQFTAPNGQPVQAQIPQGLGPPRSRSPHCPLRGNRQWAARNQWAAQVRAPCRVAAAITSTGACSQQSGGDAFTGYVADAYAGYVADDVMGAGARPAFAAEIQHTMLVNNMACCKHRYEGARAASSRTPSTR